MRMRLTLIDEYQFLTCLKFGLWGANKAKFSDWKIGDYLCFSVEKKLTALAKVVGTQYQSNDIVWNNGLYPFRIPIEFVYVLDNDSRIPVLDDLRQLFYDKYGQVYGYVIINQVLLDEKIAEAIHTDFLSRSNSLVKHQNNLEVYLDKAKSLSKNKNHLGQRKTVQSPPKRIPRVITNDKKSLDSIHTKAEYNLIQIGKHTGCQVWIASNDKNKTYNGTSFTKECMDKLPGFGLSKEALHKISMIDTLWINQDAPVCAFEVEATTSVYSGILRLSDLISVIPSINIKLYIVAPREREKKVISELNRPTFKKIGLNKYCKFIALEDLDDLLIQVKTLQGHVQFTAIDSIAATVDDSDNNSN